MNGSDRTRLLRPSDSVQVSYGDDEIVVALAEGASLGDVVTALMLEAPDFTLDDPAVLAFRRVDLAPVDPDGL